MLINCFIVAPMRSKDRCVYVLLGYFMNVNFIIYMIPSTNSWNPIVFKISTAPICKQPTCFTINTIKDNRITKPYAWNIGSWFGCFVIILNWKFSRNTTNMFSVWKINFRSAWTILCKITRFKSLLVMVSSK